MTDGAKANKRGRMLETALTSLVEDGYRQVPANKFFDSVQFNEPIFSTQCKVGEDVYGKKRRVDLILFHPDKWKNHLIIQCKWQAARGSVEEKFPFEVLSISKSRIDTIIVLDGGGYSENAEKWLKNQAGKNHLLHVMNLGEIQRFLSK